MRKMYWEELPKWERGMFSWQYCKCKFEYGDIVGEVEIISYDSSSQKLGIKYLDKDIFYISTGNFKECRIGVLINKFKNKHIYSVGEVVNNKLKITKLIPANGGNQRKYGCECIKCGFSSDMEYYKKGVLQTGEWSILEGALNNGYACPCCSNNPKIVVPDINSMWKTDHWMVELGVDSEESKKFTKCGVGKIKVICPDCNIINFKLASAIYRKKSIFCTCRDGVSIPEKTIMAILKQLNIKYETQYNPKWSNNKRYDFYIKNSNTIIETHGEQHYKYYGRGRALKEEQENDKLKKELAMANGVDEYIVIDCRESELEFIRINVLNSRLAELYDLNSVNWNKVWEFAINSNLSKQSCDLWNESNGELTTKDIGEIIGVGRCTIIKLLKRWTKIGKCDYDAKEENRKSGRNKGKKVELFKADISLGVFPSCHELERQSEELFGVRLCVTAISSCCNNDYSNNNTYKGFTFKYIEENKIA